MNGDDTSLQIAPNDFDGGNRHICAFFDGMDEHYRVLGSFISEGFERAERAVHIIDPEQREDHLQRLSRAGIDVNGAIGHGQLEVRPWQEAYVRDDRFDQDAMLGLIEEVLGTGGATGYRRTRLVAHMEWALLDKPGVDNLIEYEARLNYVLPKYDSPVICSYDLTKFGASTVMFAMRTHPVVIIGGLLQENPFYVDPDQLLAELREQRPARVGAEAAH
jgi:MEDS: MEthanogen/methylotroph, DcmR Sensory domain